MTKLAGLLVRRTCGCYSDILLADLSNGCWSVGLYVDADSSFRPACPKPVMIKKNPVDFIQVRTFVYDVGVMVRSGWAGQTSSI
jgi:hypothetical protein